MPERYAWGDIEVNVPERVLRSNGHVVAQGGRAFDLLVVLLKRGGRLVSKDELLHAVWGEAMVEEANLHVHVSALRKRLGPGVIATVPGRGYRLTGGHGAAATSPPALAPVGLGSSAATLFGRAQDLNALHGHR
jgi:DNA-binding winged helix-turn-helix (wHTH) protein